MTRASRHTLLSLDRFAAIMGINPVHFSGAKVGTTNNIFPYSGSCSQVWKQYSWQGADEVSREDLAEAIDSAEQDIASLIGYYPAPKWVELEPHTYPREHRRETGGDGTDITGRWKSIRLKYGRFIQGGTRAVSLLGTPAVVYSDPDADGFSELATITLATTLTDACDIKAFYPGHSGEEDWEIRPVVSKKITGGNVVITFHTWQLVKWDLYEVYPDQDGIEPVDITQAANILSTVDLYKEYTDSTVDSAIFYWEPNPTYQTSTTGCCTVCGGTGCPACQHTQQGGCLFVRDIYNGIAVPRPATYDTPNAEWDVASWAECREPDMVKASYYSGDLSDRYLRGLTCDPLSDDWARIIAWVAVARLERPLCSCGNIANVQDELRRDMTITPQGISQFVTQDVMTSPLGLRVGEVKAWRKIAKMTEKRARVAVI